MHLVPILSTDEVVYDGSLAYYCRVIPPETHSECIHVGIEFVFFICMSLTRLKMVQTLAVSEGTYSCL